MMLMLLCDKAGDAADSVPVSLRIVIQAVPQKPPSGGH